MAYFRRIGRRRLCRGLLGALGLAVLLLPGRFAEADEGAAFLATSVENGLLTLEARAASRSEILLAVGEKAGFEVIAGSSGSDLVDLSLTKVPIERAVARLLQGTSSVMLYEPGPDPGPGPDRLTEVRLLGSQGEPAQIRPTEADHGGAARLEAVRALAGRSDAASVAALAVVAEHDPEPSVRRAAVDSLGGLRLAKARAALITALSDEDPHVGRRAVAALERTWGGKAAPPLARLLAEGEDPAMRRLAAEALGRIGGETALTALLEAQSDPEPRVRRAAAAGLAHDEDSAG